MRRLEYMIFFSGGDIVQINQASNTIIWQNTTRWKEVKQYDTDERWYSKNMTRTGHEVIALGLEIIWSDEKESAWYVFWWCCIGRSIRGYAAVTKHTFGLHNRQTDRTENQAGNKTKHSAIYTLKILFQF